MSQVIIYQNETGGVSIVYPTQEAVSVLGIESVARKDVPAGVAFLIADASLIPEDRTFREAWEADFSNPDGYGISAAAWFAEQTEKEGA